MQKPNVKVTAMTLAAAVTLILTWLVSETLVIDIPLEVSGAIQVVVAFIIGYFVPEPA